MGFFRTGLDRAAVVVLRRPFVNKTAKASDQPPQSLSFLFSLLAHGSSSRCSLFLSPNKPTCRRAFTAIALFHNFLGNEVSQLQSRCPVLLGSSGSYCGCCLMPLHFLACNSALDGVPQCA